MYRVSRSFQKIFRQKLISRDTSCLITSAPPIVCEAAHIVEVKNHKKHPEVDIYNKNNGLLLRSDIHKLFDLHYWTIYPDEIIDLCEKTNSATFRIILNPHIIDVEYDFTELINKNITVPTKTIPYFKTRYKL